jgi:Lon protease-like protein
MHISARHIGIFPLGIFLLPGEYTRLHVFEERYKDLVNETLSLQGTFGILSTLAANTANFGAEVRVVEVTKHYDDGRMDIIVKAVSLFHLIDFNYQKEGKRYPGGTVETLHHIHNLPASKLLVTSYHELTQYRDQLRDTPSTQLDKPGILDMVFGLELDDSEKIEFAMLETPGQQENYILNHIAIQNQLCQQEDQTRYLGFYLN